MHYNLEGNWQVALLLAQFIETHIRKMEWDPNAVPSETERRQVLAAIEQDDLAANSFTLQMLTTVPFNGAWDAERHVRHLRSLISQQFDQLRPDERELFSSLSMQQIGGDLLKSLAEQYESAGDQDQAIHLLEYNARRRRWSFDAHQALAECLCRAGQRDRARAAAREAMTLAPKSNDAASFDVATCPPDSN